MLDILPSAAPLRLLIVDAGEPYDRARALAADIPCLVVAWMPELAAWLREWASDRSARRMVSVSVWADADAQAVRACLPSPVQVWRGTLPASVEASGGRGDAALVGLMKGRGEMLAARLTE